MLVLAIDTALSACSVAIANGPQTLVSRVEPMARGQAERLAPMVHEVMAQAGVGFVALDRIAVTTGPGAFTGLRVGLAFARGLALALNRPCVGVSTLELLALGASQLRSLAAIEVAGSLFVAAYEGRDTVMAPCRADAASVVAHLAGDWAVTGPGAQAILKVRPDWLHVEAALPDPALLAHMAQFLETNAHPPNPLYLRGSGAKLPGGLTLAGDE